MQVSTVVNVHILNPLEASFDILQLIIEFRNTDVFNDHFLSLADVDSFISRTTVSQVLGSLLQYYRLSKDRISRGGTVTEPN